MMRRRQFIAGLASAAASSVSWPLAARAQQAGKIWRIGMLETIPAALNAPLFDALKDGLRAHGYVEGQNLVIDYRSADGRVERFPELAAELIRLQVDLIVARGTPATLAAKNATSTIPIVMTSAAEPLLFVASLARPGGNVTGLSAFAHVLSAKRLEILRDTIPGLSRIGGLMTMSNPVTVPQWKEIEAAARSVGIESKLFDMRKPEDFAPAFDAASAQRVGALIVGLGSLIQANQKLIVELAARHRLPAMFLSREFVDAGGLMSYAPHYADLYRRAATYVDKIFKGAQPADLPIEQPTKFELVINLKTARALGLTLPQSIEARADEVIE
jgi:putative tryptophan/tyrosine transport system substrate-binding protein